MVNILIEPYLPERDKPSIQSMLHVHEPFDDMFLKSERMFAEGIFVVRYNGNVVAFLSMDGIKRKAETTIFVHDKYRRNGIGTALAAKADQMLSRQEAVERSMGTCVDGDRDSLQFLYKNGYYISYSSYIMERIGEPLPDTQETIRTYEDDDYLAWHSISEMAFFNMHERVGILPSFYFLPNERERKSYAEDRHNRYVMLVDDEIVAVGVIDGRELSHVSVRPELQSSGYGKALVIFLINEIMRRGEKAVKLCVVKGNPAKHLYENVGFKDKSLHHWLTKYYKPDTRLSRPLSN
ncbi:GNAT family N-acetyltransferase [Paenibacillus paeoniae]|uniref:GNAT family N-acetyltransferase n=1 Tax=Paenibacillus paeoniae TaxID=2292705 RepID=A0A371PM19_9BACL|nr:GNAT family N-acetyltransferase [Paenibacillus paeoniae]REK76807.1 GNAT family N-acetyltransferase [Paenibacillus paeoniae]